MSDHLKPIVEALIFASPEPLTLRMLLNQPFLVSQRDSQYDVIATVNEGGGNGREPIHRRQLVELRD